MEKRGEEKRGEESKREECTCFHFPLSKDVAALGANDHLCIVV